MEQRKPIVEYHLICLLTGTSLGGFATLDAARAYARLFLAGAWDIWSGNKRVEHHDPIDPIPPRAHIAGLDFEQLTSFLAD
jgi:hypothetical protein